MRRDVAVQAGGAVAPTGARSGQYEIRLLGPFTVLRSGERIAEQEVGSRKARTLLKRLLVDRDRTLSVDTLADVLWPDRLPDQPERHVATLVSRLRAAVGADAVVREGEGYRFGGGPAYLVDLDQAERLAAEAESRLAAGEPGLARTAANRALALLGRGDLLADEPYADWAAPARTQAAGLLRRARRSAWAAALAVRDLELAVRTAEAALAVEPFDEEACRALMRAHQDRGSPGLALAAYERLRAALAEHLGTDPAAETRDLHKAILRADREAESQRVAVPRHPAGTGSTDAGLVGRAAELEWLRGAWSLASAASPGLLLLVGEAGIGKTRLAGEVVRLAEKSGGIVAQARCYEAERSLFLQPVADALRPLVATEYAQLAAAVNQQLGGGLAELIPEVDGAVPAREHHRASPEVERRRVFQAVVGVVRTLADHAPLLLFLDDLQQAGSSTLELLHFLVRRVTGARVLVLATVRVEEGTEVVDTLGDLAQRCDLGALSEDAIRELAELELGEQDIAAGLTAQIVARTRGHTLSVVESLRAIQEQSAGPAGGSVPDSLRTAVVARMRRAGQPVEELLRAAATLDGSFDPALLAALTGVRVEAAARRADAASRARLLTEVGARYEFANDLIREIAYQTTPLPIRIARHRHAAQLLADSPEAVAAHASRAGDWPAAMAAYLAAGEAASRRYAHRDAEQLLGQAVAAASRADDPAGLARARLARGLVREARVDYQGAYEDHSTALELARSQQRPELALAALRHLGGDVPVGVGRPIRECIPYLEPALVLAETLGDVPAQVDILGRLAVIWTNRLRFDRASSYAERAVALAETHHGARVRALALDAVKTTMAYQGEVAELAELLPGLQTCLDVDDFAPLQAWTMFESAFPALAGGRWEQAADLIERAVEFSRERGYPAYQAPFLAHLAWVERARGRYGEALRVGRRAAQIAGGTGHPWWIALTETMLGWALTEVGALAEAVERLERGLAAAERDGTEGFLVRCLAHLAWAYCLRGEPERAEVLAERAETLLAGVTGGPFRHGAHAALAVATVRIGLGQPEPAHRLLEPLRDAAAGAGWVETMAWADLLLARCRLAEGRPPAAGLVAGVLAAAGQHELPGLAWQAHALLGHREAAAAIVDDLAGSIDDTGTAASYRAHAGAALDSLAGATRPQVEKGTT